MAGVQHTAVLGAGVIGASWTALFLASGRSVAVFDPADGAEEAVLRYVAQAWPTLERLGLTGRGTPDAVSFHRSAAEAVAGADFVQENVPERLEIKHATFAETEPALAEGAVVASSASGLTLGQMQGGWADPARFVLGHPFNPPHLIPLVEVMGNARTAPGVVEAAEAFYADVGKVTIRVKKEVPGHVANRLQAAVWREAIHLVRTGVASVGDVDKAMHAGPGLRWAAMGPTQLFGLGAGAGGLAAFCAHFEETFNGWWDDLGQPYLDAETAKLLETGLEAATNGASLEAQAEERDAMIVALLEALAQTRRA
ncbi:3-hydroxyacyl-CoA dehydrogenase [Roseovarius faecimaris]|uniref:3-hydroxyacyl-CoA dehydrogenase n=1 Tax=Roseovarius faecimaris TaxID=2494550 RepID=A0A6I6ILY0_9RHOB|nr:3-hydroxyacyl-CoA dehydrogenase NAD-binding domain-containing protein [Roseovarius faecimaris]QGX97575.1 3-hydroxyacyl-CoA dehydrogenase [Roseovarius faecimaris]